MSSIGINRFAFVGKANGISDSETVGTEIADKLRKEFGDGFARAEPQHLLAVREKYFATPGDEKSASARRLLDVMITTLGGSVEKREGKQTGSQGSELKSQPPAKENPERTTEVPDAMSVLEVLTRANKASTQTRALREEEASDRAEETVSAESLAPLDAFPLAAENRVRIVSLLAGATRDTAAIAFRDIQRLTEPGSGVHRIAVHLGKIAELPGCSAAPLGGARGCMVDGSRTLINLLALSREDVSAATAKIVFYGMTMQWGTLLERWKASTRTAFEAREQGVERLEQELKSMLGYLEGLPDQSDSTRELLAYGRQKLEKLSDFPHNVSKLWGISDRTIRGWKEFVFGASELIESLDRGLHLSGDISSNP